MMSTIKNDDTNNIVVPDYTQEVPIITSAYGPQDSENETVNLVGKSPEIDQEFNS